MADNFNLAEMPEAEFSKFIDGLQSAPVQRDELPPSVDQRTRDAINQASQVLNLKVSKDYVSPEGKRIGIRPDTFLDVQSGAPASVRWSMGLDENQLNQFKLLNQRYGPGNVDLSSDGRFIIRNQPDEFGGKKDILVDPVGFDTGDIAQMGSQIIPMVAGAAAAFAGGKVKGGPIAKVLTAAGLGALGQEVASGLQQAAVRQFRNDTVNASDIAIERAKASIADMALGLAAAGGAKVASKFALAAGGLIGLGSEPTQTALANRGLRESTGVKFPLSPGQESEHPFLLRTENILRARPGSAGAMDDILAAQQKAEGELRRVFLGLPRTMSDEELQSILPRSDIVGGQGLRRLGTEANRLEGNVSSAASDIAKTATDEAQAIADVNLASPLNVSEVGQVARQKAITEFKQFRSDISKQYNDFLSKPEISNRIVDGTEIANAARQAESELIPSKETGKGIEPLETFVPSKIRSTLEELKALDGSQVSINDLKKIRTSISNMRAEGVAIPGTDIHQIDVLHDVVDSGITDALKSLPDPKLLQTWEQLNAQNAIGMSRFNRTGIREMLVPEGQSGSLGNAKVAERIIGNSADALDRYNEYKQFFGAGSQEFKNIQQVAREQALRGSIDRTSGYVSSDDLKSSLSNVRPEVLEELFGTSEKDLRQIGKILESSQGKNLDIQELSDLSKSGSLTASKIQSLIDAEQERVTMFSNKLVKAAANGTLNAEKIRPSDFVRSLSNMDAGEATKVLGVLSDRPDLVEDVKQLAIEDLWSKVQAGASGAERVSGKLIDEVLGDKSKQETWKTVIGQDAVDGLKQLMNVLRSRDFSTASFKGGLAAQQDIQKLLFSPGVGELKQLATRYLISFLYSGPLKRSVVNLMTSQDRGRFLNAVIASTPFIEGAIQRFGSDGALGVIGSLRSAVEPIQHKSLFIEGKVKDGIDPATLSTEDFKKWLDNNQIQ